MRPIGVIFALTLVWVASFTAHAAEPPVPLAQVSRVFSTSSGAELSLPQLITELSTFDAVFLGETHTDEVTHRLEAYIYRELLEQREGKVILAMEMFDKDAQESLSAYVSGAKSEAEFLASTRVWPNYRTGYRALVELARKYKAPAVASNLSLRVRRALGFGGKEAWEQLDEELRSLVPPQLHANSPAYWKRFERAVRGHAGMLSGQSDESRLYSVQSLWDNSMGWSSAEALAQYEGHSLVHVNGGFHSAYRDGTVAQFLIRSPESRAVTVALEPTHDLAAVEVDPGEKLADYIVYCEARAEGYHDGHFTVQAPRDVRYQLHIPKGVESPPLLVWLHGDGLSASDAMAYWKMALGSEAAIAVLEAPYPQIEDDLYRGGRWFWLDRFSQDVGAVTAAIYRIVRYISRYSDVDPARMILAGEGTGATVVASLALYRSELPVQCLVFGPAKVHKLRDASLPDPEMKRVRASESAHDIEVWGTASQASWWEQELGDFRSVGMKAQWQEVAQPRNRQLIEAEVRSRMSLPGAGAADGAKRLVLSMPAHTPLSAHWASLVARAAQKAGRPSRVVSWSEVPEAHGEIYPLAFSWEVEGYSDLSSSKWLPYLSAEDFSDATGLPTAPGPFGGTTVVVLPAAASEQARTDWRELESQNVLRLRSRFHSLKVAIQGSDRSLAAVLKEIQDAGKKNVLVVPAAFYAGASHMRALRDEAGAFEDSLTLHWLPGLGGRVHLLRQSTIRPAQ